ncbi:MAG: hypothetical protein IT223_00780, partial [Crocinitomicaceae bacterium]|nr:hypothetical protein [Crocinitomicaceae bacterium]
MNLLLIVAVGYLFFKIPGQKKTDNTDLKVASAFSDTVTVRAPVLAYVNGDSLNEQYDFIK